MACATVNIASEALNKKPCWDVTIYNNPETKANEHSGYYRLANTKFPKSRERIY